MKYDIVTFGIPMVEIMRKELDCPFEQVGEFEGPYPAGDPGICLNQCVVLGHRGCYVGVVGNDPLSNCFFRQMEKSGVDYSHIRRVHGYTTAMSLLAKFSDGSRSFVFNLSESAAAQLGPADFDKDLLKQVKWIHVSGFALSVSESIARLHDMVMEEISEDVLVSFDPNYRNEMIDAALFRKRCRKVYDRCNLFLPSMGEAVLFEAGKDDLEACAAAARKGKQVALKAGRDGAYGFDGIECVYEPGFAAEETDPTGAGDTFGGALIAALIEGMEWKTALRFGCAAGSICVQRKGLMDIAPVRGEIEAVMTSV